MSSEFPTYGELYPEAGDGAAIRGAADEPESHASTLHGIASDLETDGHKTRSQAQGAPEKVAENPAAAAETLKTLSRNGQYATALIRQFSYDVDTFDRKVDAINAQNEMARFFFDELLGIDRPEVLSKPHLKGEWNDAFDALETAGDETAVAFRAGPTADRARALILAGMMPLSSERYWGDLGFTPAERKDLAHRTDDLAAFIAATGHAPRTPLDWKTAAMLNPESYLGKNKGYDANILVGRITPRPGDGLVRLGWFIPVHDVFNVPDNDLGDDRGFDPDFNPEETRVGVYIDYENGLVIARNNPSVTSDGEVKVGTPDIQVQQHPDGRVRIFYEATNPWAPPGATLTGHTVHGDIVAGPDGVSGRISDYPSLEGYHDSPGSDTPTTLIQDEADDSVLGEETGPLENLPFMHEVGDNPMQNINDFYKEGMDGGRHDYEWRNPHLKYPDRYPFTELGSPDDPPEIQKAGE